MWPDSYRDADKYRPLKFNDMGFAGKTSCFVILSGIFIFPLESFSQVKWTIADSAFGPLPATVHIYRVKDSLDGRPFIAYYAEAKLNEGLLDFTTDTTRDRRLTPGQFYQRNSLPLIVVNCTFFSYETNRSLNLVINEGHLLAYNLQSLPMRGKDTFQYRHVLGSAIGITKKGKADIAWVITDSTHRYAYASQVPLLKPIRDSVGKPSFGYLKDKFIANGDSTVSGRGSERLHFKKWKMKTAVGGGPVLLQNGELRITNEEEMKFAGKAINDKHPRTVIGYTADGRLIIMVIEGRYPGRAEGATLRQEAILMKDLGCVEAMNLDGGGSSCMLINGKETIKPSEKGEERAVPAVFIIKIADPHINS